MITARTSTALFGNRLLISLWTIVYRTNGSDGSYWIPPAGRSLANCPGSQLAWLEQELCDPTDCPTILALHHPVYGTTTAETDANNLATPDRLIRLLQDHPVDGILCGHSHEATLVTEQGLPPQFVGAGAPLRLYR